MTSNIELAARWERAFMGTYATPRIALTHGRGSRVWDADGRRYLDLVGGIAVSALGHAHPRLVAAVTEQVSRLAHTSNLYAHGPGVALAERLLALVDDALGRPGGGRVFLCNSGTEAVEAAFKLVRQHAGPERPRLVSTHGGFHGRTMGALSLTGSAPKRAGFAPFPAEVTFVEYGDPDALAAAVDERTAAVVLEPVQGENGVVVPPDGYLAAARAASDAAGALLVVDEVQTGIGRTGHWFGFEHDRVVPDVVTLAKGLGGGLPIGACVGLGRAAGMLARGMHGSTFGGNPVAAAAALAVLDVVAEEDLVGHSAALGDRWMRSLRTVGHPALGGVRGRGLLVALELVGVASADVETAAAAAGFLVNAVTPDAVRLAPPLVLTDAEAQEFTAALPQIFEAALRPVKVAAAATQSGEAP